MDQTPAESFMTLVDTLLRTIVPDEARILSALSDGSVYPVVHIESSGIGRSTRRLLSNASTVGRVAGVALPSRTPDYLTHMLTFGLIEIGPEDATIPHDEYEILMTDSTVKRARELAGGGPLVQTRFVKRAVRISDLGSELWRACQPDGNAGPGNGAGLPR
jgi:hypothetical protein